jgi:hypothetical protein
MCRRQLDGLFAGRDGVNDFGRKIRETHEHGQIIAPDAEPRRHGIDAVITARKEHVARCIARAIREARPLSIAFAEPLPMISRTPFPARRRLAAIVRTNGSTGGTESVGLEVMSCSALDTIALRSSHTKI